MAKMTREEIKEKCLGYIQQTAGDMVDLQSDRENATKWYLQRPYGNEVEGRSQVVMSDVHDTIQWAMPHLMKVFWSGTDPVKISAVGPDDEIKSRLLQHKVNYDIQRGLNGYTLFHDWIFDALLYKLGVIKYWWEERTEWEAKEYDDLTELEFAVLQQDPDLVIEEVESEQEMILDPMTGMEVVTATYSVKGKKKNKISKPMAEVVPPEEFIFDVTMKDVESSAFIAHRKRMHKDVVMKKWKVKEDEVSDMVREMESDTIFQDRFSDLGGAGMVRSVDDEDYWYVYECYVNIYEDGLKKPKKVVILGTKLLEVEDNSYGCPPFCCITPERISHRVVGRSYADLVGDIQKLHTAIVRYEADAVYFTNNQRWLVDPTAVHMDDFTNNNIPGGVIRTKGGRSLGECVMPLPNPSMPAHVLDFREAVRQLSENRTGITRFNMGTDQSSANRTATGISQIMGAGMARLEQVARGMAEDGFKKLFTAFAKMNIDYLENEVAIKVNEEWMMIKPSDIDIKFDVSVDVAIGSGTKDMQVQQLLQLLNVTVPLMQFGVVSPNNIYNMLAVIYENLGYRNPDRFITDPMEQMQQQQAMMMMGGGIPGVNPGGMASATGVGQTGQPDGGGSQPPVQQSPVSRVFQGNINPNF